MPGLSQVRRLEAVSFRSWPATTTHYDGSWAIRLTAGHPAKRLNSVNPLDPSDHARMEERIQLAAERFKAFGRPLVFRLSPLAPADLINILDARGWLRFDETIVMATMLDQAPLDDAIDQLPIRDVGRWIDDIITMNGAKGELKPGLSELIGAVQSTVGLFVTGNNDGVPHCAAMCVHDNDLAGLFEVVTHPDYRQQGRAREITKTALKWARGRGAKRAWLQVVAANKPAVNLYQSMGFSEIYRYIYRKAPDNRKIDTHSNQS